MVCIGRPEFRIISDEQFEKAQQIKEKNAKQYCQREKRSNKHLFSNLIKCNSCGFSYRRYQKQYSPNRPPKFGGLAQNAAHTAAADVIPNTSALMKIG